MQPLFILCSFNYTYVLLNVKQKIPKNPFLRKIGDSDILMGEDAFGGEGKGVFEVAE